MTARQAALFKPEGTIYCVDTSAFLDLYRRSHPMEQNPSLWAKLAEMAEAARFVAPKEVLRELSVHDDQLSAWANARKGMFVAPDEDLQETLSEVLSVFPGCVSDDPRSAFADPWVVALAKLRQIPVLTFEVPSGNSQGVKIPDMCKHFGVPYLTPWKLIEIEGWRF